MRIVYVKEPWKGHGIYGRPLGQAILLNGMSWTPVVWDGDEDPNWCRTRALAICDKCTRICEGSFKKN